MNYTALIIKNGEVYLPEKVGKKDILSLYGRIQKLGDIDISSLDNLGFQHTELDATDAYVVPGFIDPHEHLVGGDGEGGYATRTPPIQLPELLHSGITTVVGCLGTDNVTFNPQTLLGHVRGLREEGMTAFLWAGGYTVPPVTITGTLRSDIMLIPEIIGAGETAVSDVRSSQPLVSELSKVVSDTYNGGLLTQKCGATHFHMGPGKHHLKPIIELIDTYDIDKMSVFPTHIGRNEELMIDACELTRRGFYVNMDTTEQDLLHQIELFEKHKGVYEFLTLSTDASVTSPSTLYTEVKKVLLELKWPLEKVLPLLTTQTAKVLKLPTKGALHIGYDTDIVVLEKGTYNIRHVVANGIIFIKDGKFVHDLKVVQNSNRRFEFHGKKSTR